jgi:hypothetical protein
MVGATLPKTVSNARAGRQPHEETRRACQESVQWRVLSAGETLLRFSDGVTEIRAKIAALGTQFSPIASAPSGQSVWDKHLQPEPVVEHP